MTHFSYTDFFLAMLQLHHCICYYFNVFMKDSFQGKIAAYIKLKLFVSMLFRVSLFPAAPLERAGKVHCSRVNLSSCHNNYVYLGFLLPPESGEKVSLEVTVLLSQAVFLLVISDFLPPSAQNFPILGKHKSGLLYMYTTFVSQIHE